MTTRSGTSAAANAEAEAGDADRRAARRKRTERRADLGDLASRRREIAEGDRIAVVRLVTLGVGAQNSPRYAPAGLLVAHGRVRVMIDGGPGAVPSARVDAWLVTDARSELITAIRRLAGAQGLVPYVGPFNRDGLRITDRAVVHTAHPTCGYRIEAGGLMVVWAPEFYEFPRWARGADVMFAEAAAWNRPIRFAGGVGGHLDVHAVARAARRHGIKRLVFAHIGRPTLRALDRGLTPPFGEFAADGQVFVCASRRGHSRRRGPS